METIVPAIIILAVIAAIIGFLVFINNRDRKKEARKQQGQ